MPTDALDKRSRAVLLLAAGRASDSVGAEIGANGRTVRRWLDDPEFRAEIAAARRRILDEAVGALAAAARDAVTTLHGELNNSSAAIRVRAATSLLSALPAITQHAEFADRIAALEAAVTDQASA